MNKDELLGYLACALKAVYTIEPSYSQSFKIVNDALIKYNEYKDNEKGAQCLKR